MQIERALRLKIGEAVRCPASKNQRGHDGPDFTGTITGVSPIIATNAHGDEYIWVEVRGPAHKSLWPSNRLGALQ
jgi:hypothetical protein